MTDSSPSASGSSKPAKAFSCVRCFERKVKCDKDHPCAGCVRSNVECTFRVPAPPRRKKKRTQEDILTERLNQYEQILQQKGIDVDNVPTKEDKSKSDKVAESGGASTKTRSDAPSSKVPPAGDPRTFVTPKLIWEEGRSRYTENNLWTRVAEEFPTSQDAFHESSDEESAEDEPHEIDDNVDYALGWTPGSMSTKNLHPPPEHISHMWQIFLDNVNPFTMMLHQPTMTPTIQKAMINLDHLPRNLEVLMFAVYSIAIMSMQEREVDDAYGETRQTLLSRYRNATKAALARAKFMGSSDMLVLQAFILHLLSMREIYDGRTLWTLSGVALRIGEGMGLHRDGTILGLPPFQTEMRRRLWYQITALDYRSAELSGSSKFRLLGNPELNTKAPLNVNDEELWPEMKDFPIPQQKTTQMILCCLRYEFSTFWMRKVFKKSDPRAEAGTVWENFKSPTSIEEQDANIDELERILEEKYVRYCDPSIPRELMASIVARTATHTMRFMAHHPRRWATDDDIPEDERKMIWKLSMKIIEGYNMCITFKSIERFTWHTAFYFQWQALIYLLDCVRADPLMPQADEVWKNINEIFGFHTQFVTDTKKAIHIAVGSLCLKAYSARETAFRKEGRFLPAKPPEYIRTLRKQRDAAAAKQAERKARAESRSQSQSGPSTSVSVDLMNMMGFEATPQVASSNISQPQMPLPYFQSPSNQHRTPSQQQSPFSQQTTPQQIPNQFISGQQQPQQPQQPQQAPNAFWFDSFNSMSQFTGADMEWMMMQDPSTTVGNQMDWTQWDFLLQDEAGTIDVMRT